MVTYSIPTDKASPQPQSSDSPVSPGPAAEAGGTFLPDAPEYQGLKSKFNSPEALAKSYLELEKRLGQPAGSPQPTSEAPGTPPATENTQQQVVPGALSQSDFDALSQEYAQAGKLSDESYASLEQRGLGRQVVDTYIEGQRALQERQVGEVFAAAGIKGMDEYQKINSWATQNLPKDEITAINASLGGKDLGAVKVALTALQQRYSQANGQAPSLLQGRLASGPAVAPYGSSAQVTADMKSARYKKDEAFRNEVRARLAVSPDILNTSIRRT